jgi:hypothetical protein
VLLPAVNSEPPTGHVPRATICFLDPGWSWNICPVSHHLCMDIHLYVCTASIYIYNIYIQQIYIYIFACVSLLLSWRHFLKESRLHRATSKIDGNIYIKVLM